MTGLLKHTLLPLSLLILLTGCKTLLQQDSETTLQNTLKAYEATLRWGYPGQVYNFLQQDLKEKTPIPASLQHIKITGYKVIKQPASVDETRAAQMVIIGYVHQERQIEHSLTDNQLWEYDEENNSWSRINPIPEFK